MNKPEPVNLPAGVELAMRKDGKTIPIMSLNDLKEKLAAEEALATREAQRKAAEEAANKNKTELDEKIKVLEGICYDMYHAMIVNKPVKNSITLGDINAQFCKFLNETFLPNALPGYVAIIATRHLNVTTIDNRVIQDCDSGTLIEFMTVAEYKAWCEQHPVKVKPLINKHDKEKILGSQDDDAKAKKPAKKTKTPTK